MGSEAIEWPGKTWGSTTPQRKGSVHKEGRRAGRGSGGGEGKLQTQRGECIGEGSSSNCLQRPSRRHSVSFSIMQGVLRQGLASQEPALGTEPSWSSRAAGRAQRLGPHNAQPLPAGSHRASSPVPQHPPDPSHLS